jgi:predicted GNAT family acetyltransferase
VGSVWRVDIQVRNAPDNERYEAYVGDVLAGFSQYTTPGDAVVFTHTEVEPEFEGEGIGSTLVRDALDDVRRRGLKVVPRCQFVAEYIERHPDEYGDLVAGDRGQ